MSTTDLSTVIYRSFPFFATIAVVDLWWPVVRDDPVLFHVTLLLSCLSLESLQEQKNCLQSKQLLTECISLLSTRVQDPLLGVSDETIVAVANLATIEVIISTESIQRSFANHVTNIQARKGQYETIADALEWTQAYG